MKKLPKSKPKHRYTWIPDLPDQRDLLFIQHADFTSTPLPDKVDLRPSCSPVVNQGPLGSCTGNALAGQMEFLELKEMKAGSGPEVFDPATFSPVSRLFIYYNERAIEGTISQDAGAMIRDGVKSLNKQGVCRESIWAYDTSKFTKKPTTACYNEAAKHKITSYARVVGINNILAALAGGNPVVFGFTVYESFESDEVARTGIVPMPARHEKTLGGHAVLAVGYDMQAKSLIVKNSWGSDWGDKGYFHLPFDYAAQLGDDFWTITK